MSKTIATDILLTEANGIKINTDYLHILNCNVKESRTVAYVVMHYTGNSADKAVNNAKYFKNGSRGASAHYFVDDTTIYQSVGTKNTAWHCGTTGTYYNNCRNSTSIGIEMCCSSNFVVSAKTIENAVYLCAAICEKLNIKASEVEKYVVRHYDVTHKHCPAQFVRNENEWHEFKAKVKALLGENASYNNNEDVETKGGSTVTVTLTVLEKGSKGKEVKTLQRLLISCGYSCGSAGADGDFGNGTLSAVKKYQTAHKLSSDGIVGAKTWESILKNA